MNDIFPADMYSGAVKCYKTAFDVIRNRVSADVYRLGELAWTCCDYADTLRKSESEDDRAKAMSLLDESLAITGKQGMRPLMYRVLSRREILKA